MAKHAHARRGAKLSIGRSFLNRSAYSAKAPRASQSVIGTSMRLRDGTKNQLQLGQVSHGSCHWTGCCCTNLRK